MKIRSGILWGAMGVIAPLLGAAVSIPTLILVMGDARFGILTLSWVVVGYFGFFDLGLGRALTHLVATRIGAGKINELPALISAGFVLLAILGIVGGLFMAAFAEWISYDVLSIQGELRAETLSSLYLLAVSIPIVIVSSGLRGILEGFHRFDLVNLIKAPLGLLTYVGPLLVLPFTEELPGVVAVLLAGRIIMLLAYGFTCSRIIPVIDGRAKFSRIEVRELLAYGGWLTLSNIAGPLLLYLGRFFLVIAISAEAVAYFSTPYEVAIALLLIPGVYVSVLFPNFAQGFQHRVKDVIILYKKWQFYTLISMFPLCITLFILARPALALWISPDFAERSYHVAQILSIGIFINSFGYISQCLIQAYGRPDLTAKLHIVELILYVPYLWWFVSTSGIEGAAIAWSIRVLISTIALATIAYLCMTRIIESYTRNRLNANE